MNDRHAACVCLSAEGLLACHCQWTIALVVRIACPRIMNHVYLFKFSQGTNIGPSQASALSSLTCLNGYCLIFHHERIRHFSRQRPKRA